MPTAIGPNGPVPIDAGAYEYSDLNGRVVTALAGDDVGRGTRTAAAIRAAKKTTNTGGGGTPAPTPTPTPGGALLSRISGQPLISRITGQPLISRLAA